MLLAKGHSLLLTTRKYREAQEMLRFRRLRHVVVGRHGGGSVLGKLLASADRIFKLTKIIDKWSPDVALSFSSPEAARVAFGLGIPHVVANDSPHSRMVARLAVPLSTIVCSPWIIGADIWKAFGARRVVTYRALDPASWLKRHRPNPKVLDELSLDRSRPIVVLRTEEAFASYLIGRASDKTPVVLPIIERLLSSGTDAQIVVSTRYGLQAPVLRRKFGHRVKVLDRIVDATSLIYYSSAFVGSGGTMTVEAALLGTPAISCFPGEKPLYIRYLERRNLVSTIRSPRKTAAVVQDVVDHPEKYEGQKQAGRRLLAWMEDPIATLFSALEKAWRK